MRILPIPLSLTAWCVLGLLWTERVDGHPGSGIVVLANGDVVFTHGNALVKVNEKGEESILIQDKTKQQFYQLHHLVKGNQSDLYTASDIGTGIWKLALDGVWSRHYPGREQDPLVYIGLGGDPFTIDATGNIFLVNCVWNKTSQILRLSPSGELNVMAGGAWGYRDGVGLEARFGDLHGSSMWVHADGRLFLTDHGIAVRCITPEGHVSTLGIKPTPAETDANDKEQSVHFKALRGIVLDAQDNVYVADARPGESGCVFKITPEDKVTLVAGQARTQNLVGAALEVKFVEPTGLAFGPKDELFILEPLFPRIRKLTPSGQVTWVFKGFSQSP